MSIHLCHTQIKSSIDETMAQTQSLVSDTTRVFAERQTVLQKHGEQMQAATKAVVEW